MTLPARTPECLAELTGDRAAIIAANDDTPLWLEPVEDVSPVRWRVTVALGIAFIIQCIILWRP